MNSRIFRIGNLFALILVGFCLHSQAAPRAMTFAQAVEQGKGLKGCPKRDIGALESVYLSDSQGNPKGVKPGAPIYLVFQTAGAASMPVVGPLAVAPTEAQLQALRGARTCVISE